MEAITNIWNYNNIFFAWHVLVYFTWMRLVYKCRPSNDHALWNFAMLTTWTFFSTLPIIPFFIFATPTVFIFYAIFSVTRHAVGVLLAFGHQSKTHHLIYSEASYFSSPSPSDYQDLLVAGPVFYSQK